MKPILFMSTAADFTLKVKSVEKKMGGKIVPAVEVCRFINGRFTAKTDEQVEALRACSEYGKRISEISEKDLEDVADIKEALAEVKAKRKGRPPKQTLSKKEEMDRLRRELEAAPA